MSNQYAVFENDEVKKFLESLESNLKKVKDGDFKYRGLLSSIVYADVMDHFNKQESDSGPWKQWSSGYKKYMRSIGKEGNKILQDTGRLRNNFKPQKVKRTSQGYMWFNDASTSKGFPYAYAHNEGGPQLPKRKFMWLSNNAIDKISVQTLQFIISEGL